MARTPTQNKAIAWWATLHDLTLQLSTHPMYYFRNIARFLVPEVVHRVGGNER